MDAERIPEHFEHTRSNEVRILPAMELMGKVELSNYPSDPIELRRRELHQSLRERSNQIQVIRHRSPL
jgi:hypothetical protein